MLLFIWSRVCTKRNCDVVAVPDSETEFRSRGFVVYNLEKRAHSDLNIYTWSKAKPHSQAANVGPNNTISCHYPRELGGGGALQVMASTGMLHPKGVPFSDLRDIKR